MVISSTGSTKKNVGVGPTPRVGARTSGIFAATGSVTTAKPRPNPCPGWRRSGKSSSGRMTEGRLLPETVLRHQTERSRPEQPVAIELAATQEHLSEPVIVAGRSVEAATSGQERGQARCRRSAE